MREPLFLFVPSYFERSCNKVAGIAYRISRIADVLRNFDARPFGENILPVAGTHDLHSKSVWLSSTGCRSRREYPDREPSGDGCARCYENCELPPAISRVRGVFRDKKKKKERKRGNGRMHREAITRSDNFVRPSASARCKNCITKRSSFMTTLKITRWMSLTE